jgi:mRNA interferase MazF
VLLRSETGLAKDSVALCEQLRAIAKTRLVKRLGALAPASMKNVNETLCITLDL